MDHTGGLFPTTSPTLVEQAQSDDEGEASRALGTLYETYWSPLYTFLRKTGDSPDQAEDNLQNYFEALVEKNWIRNFESRRGRLRSFFLHCLKRLRNKEWRKMSAEKRGGGAVKISIDQEVGEKVYLSLKDPGLSPEEAFDRAWAMTVIEIATRRLGDEFEKKGKVSEFEVLAQYLEWNAGETTYREAAEALNRSQGAVRAAVKRMREKFRAILIDEVRQTTGLPPGDGGIQEEIGDLFRALG